MLVPGAAELQNAKKRVQCSMRCAGKSLNRRTPRWKNCRTMLPWNMPL
jgi:hypothetical protein